MNRSDGISSAPTTKFFIFAPMLKELRISNYALIEELGLRPDESLNTITGETGAGKSIMLGALGLILGQRADLTVLRDPTRKCVVEANFDVSKLGLEAFFEEHNLDLEPVSIVRREIVPSGKSYAFVNGKPVKLPVLCGLSEHLNRYPRAGSNPVAE